MSSLRLGARKARKSVAVITFTAPRKVRQEVFDLPMGRRKCVSVETFTILREVRQEVSELLSVVRKCVLGVTFTVSKQVRRSCPVCAWVLARV